MLLLWSADFFSKLTFLENSFRNNIRRVQTVCKGYQQMTKVTDSMERVKFSTGLWPYITTELFSWYEKF